MTKTLLKDIEWNKLKIKKTKLKLIWQDMTWHKERGNESKTWMNKKEWVWQTDKKAPKREMSASRRRK